MLIYQNQLYWSVGFYYFVFSSQQWSPVQQFRFQGDVAKVGHV
jgi:hypothetical protein